MWRWKKRQEEVRELVSQSLRELLPDLTKQVAESVTQALAKPSEPVAEAFSKIVAAMGESEASRIRANAERSLADAKAEDSKANTAMSVLNAVSEITLKRAASEFGRAGGKASQQKKREREQGARTGAPPGEWCIVCQTHGRKGSAQEIARHNAQGHDAMLEAQHQGERPPQERN